MKLLPVLMLGIDIVRVVCNQSDVLMRGLPVAMFLGIGCTLLMIHRTALGGLFSVLAYWICAWGYGIDGQYLAGEMLLGWFVLFCRMPLWLALLLWSMNVAMECLFSMVMGSTVMLMLPNIACVTMAASAGVIWLLVRERAARAALERELLQTKERALQLRCNMIIASHIHDAVSNDLSYIITIADMMQMNNGEEAAGASLASISERAHAAFAQTHTIIRALNGNNAPQCSESQTNLTHNVGMVLRNVDRELHVLGFTGAIHVSLPQTMTLSSPVAEAETLSLLAELGANIRKHCNPLNDEYSFHIAADDTMLRIVQVNTVSAQQPDTDASDANAAELTGGQGLHMHELLITELGGEMQYHEQQGVWVVAITIPR
ncbi:hypothetical protein [Bifidobacterium oedipodis]|uniref:Histidine kinase n=1 Tax=Bifidobacterium oedipodis TaxID=2675322 RepID=A0A7Y0EQ34_9BIFI|nr:hypothetical protein [Bifidobacterium sp. DSM 109957]NMM94299.1 histidine kinase [Bifidobacterium sp. DSM 109957]